MESGGLAAELSSNSFRRSTRAARGRRRCSTNLTARMALTPQQALFSMEMAICMAQQRADQGRMAWSLS